MSTLKSLFISKKATKHCVLKLTILGCLCFGSFSCASAASLYQFPDSYTARDGTVYSVKAYKLPNTENVCCYVTVDKTKYAIVTYASDLSTVESVTVGENKNVVGGTNNNISTEDANGAIVGGNGNYVSGYGSVAVSGNANIVSGKYAATVGGTTNQATGYGAVTVGGLENIASGSSSFVGGGIQNTASGEKSVALSGESNTASGTYSLTVGGVGNIASGKDSVTLGGYYVSAVGEKSVAIGGESSFIAGKYGVTRSFARGESSITIGAANTTENARASIAIGLSSVAAAELAMAIGNESSATEEQTISFGHYKGDPAYYVKEGDSYTRYDWTDDFFHRLTKVADGVDNHDAATVEQLWASTSFDGDSYKITLSAKNGSTLDIDLSSIPKYSAGNGIYISSDHKISVSSNAIDSHVFGNSNVFAFDDSEKSSPIIDADWVIGDNNTVFSPAIKMGEEYTSGSQTIVFGHENSSTSSYTSILGSRNTAGGIGTNKDGKNIGEESLLLSLVGTGNTVNGLGNSVVGMSNYIVYSSSTDTDGTQITNANMSSLSSAIGANNYIYGSSSSTSIGYGNYITNGNGSTAFGYSNHISNDSSGVAIGSWNTHNSSNNSFSFGSYNQINGSYSGAIGSSNQITTTSFSDGTTTSSYTSFAIGNHNYTYNSDALALGTDNFVYTSNSFVAGDWNLSVLSDYYDSSNLVSNRYIIGKSNCLVMGSYSVVIGIENNVNRSSLIDDYDNNFVFGKENKIYAGHSTVLGENNQIVSSNSLVLGTNNFIREGHTDTFILGKNNFVNADNAIAVGFSATNDESNTISFGHSAGDWTGYYLDSSGNQTVSETTYDSSTKTNVANAKELYADTTSVRLTHVANGINAQDASTVSQLISSGTFDSENKKITLSSDAGKTVDIDLSNLITGNAYSAGSHISITDNILDTIGLIAYDSESMDKATLSGVNGTRLSNLKQGIVSSVSSDAVTGAQLYSVNQSIAGFAADIKKNASDLASLSSAIADHEASTLSATTLVQTLSDSKADLSLGNLTTSGENKIKSLAKSVLDDYFSDADNASLFSNYAVATMDLAPDVSNQIAVVDNTTATTDYVDSAVADKATKTELADGLSKKADITYVDNAVADKATKAELAEGLAKKADLSYINEELGKKADLSYVNEKLDTKADVDGSNIDVTKYTTKLGIGEIAKDNENLVTGGKVYEATQSVLSESKSYTDTAVNTLSSQVEQAMGQMYSSLNKDINRGVAKASALAALKPLEYDPEDKFNFAVGYGHYKNANSTALGAFYYANANTLVNVGATIGNRDTAINAGISFKIGRGSGYNGVSKAAMLSALSEQQRRLDAQDAEIEELKQAVRKLIEQKNKQFM